MSFHRPTTTLSLALASAVLILTITSQAQARMGGGGFGGGSMTGMGGQTTTLAPGRTRGWQTQYAPPPAANPNYGGHRGPHLFIPGQYGDTSGNTATGLPK